jgi:hypothetical protein
MNAQAKAMIEQEVGWTARKPRKTPAVQVELGGKQVGGPVDVERSIWGMESIWNEMTLIAERINELDDLIDRQQQWLDAHEVGDRWLKADAEKRKNIEARNVLWRDRLPALEKQAEQVVEKMSPDDRHELTVVHEWAPMGGTGLMQRFSQLAPLLEPHPEMWPNGECPF